MPVIGFTDRDLLRGNILTPAWYVMRIEAVGEKPSADGNSTNYPVEGTVLREADTGATEGIAGTPVDWNFNSKAIGFAVGFLESLGFKAEKGKRYELNAAAGKEIEVFVENDTWQGRMVNRVNHKYRPLRG